MSEAKNYIRKIKCPQHYMVDPREDIYLRELVPELKNVSKSLIASGRARNMRCVRDPKTGQKLVDWKKVEKLKKLGKIVQPQMSASFFIEHVWDSQNPICVHICKGRCKRGKGNILERTIERLVR